MFFQSRRTAAARAAELRPGELGRQPQLDDWKADSMRVAFGLRDVVRPAIRAFRKP